MNDPLLPFTALGVLIVAFLCSVLIYGICTDGWKWIKRRMKR
jgi:hypothetical protein